MAEFQQTDRDDDISKLFRKHERVFDTMPPRKVWHKLEMRLDTRHTRRRMVMFRGTTAAAAVFAVVAVFVSLQVLEKRLDNNASDRFLADHAAEQVATEQLEKTKDRPVSTEKETTLQPTTPPMLTTPSPVVAEPALVPVTNVEDLATTATTTPSEKPTAPSPPAPAITDAGETIEFDDVTSDNNAAPIAEEEIAVSQTSTPRQYAESAKPLVQDNWAFQLFGWLIGDWKTKGGSHQETWKIVDNAYYCTVSGTNSETLKLWQSGDQMLLERKQTGTSTVYRMVSMTNKVAIFENDAHQQISLAQNRDGSYSWTFNAPTKTDEAVKMTAKSGKANPSNNLRVLYRNK